MRGSGFAGYGGDGTGSGFETVERLPAEIEDGKAFYLERDQREPFTADDFDLAFTAASLGANNRIGFASAAGAAAYANANMAAGALAGAAAGIAVFARFQGSIEFIVTNALSNELGGEASIYVDGVEHQVPRQILPPAHSVYRAGMTLYVSGGADLAAGEQWEVGDTPTIRIFGRNGVWIAPDGTLGKVGDENPAGDIEYRAGYYIAESGRYIRIPVDVVGRLPALPRDGLIAFVPNDYSGPQDRNIRLTGGEFTVGVTGWAQAALRNAANWNAITGLPRVNADLGSIEGVAETVGALIKRGVGDTEYFQLYSLIAPVALYVGGTRYPFNQVGNTAIAGRTRYLQIVGEDTEAASWGVSDAALAADGVDIQLELVPENPGEANRWLLPDNTTTTTPETGGPTVKAGYYFSFGRAWIPLVGDGPREIAANGNAWQGRPTENAFLVQLTETVGGVSFDWMVTIPKAMLSVGQANLRHISLDSNPRGNNNQRRQQDRVGVSAYLNAGENGALRLDTTGWEPGLNVTKVWGLAIGGPWVADVSGVVVDSRPSGAGEDETARQLARDAQADADAAGRLAASKLGEVKVGFVADAAGWAASVAEADGSNDVYFVHTIAPVTVDDVAYPRGWSGIWIETQNQFVEIASDFDPDSLVRLISFRALQVNSAALLQEFLSADNSRRGAMIIVTGDFTHNGVDYVDGERWIWDTSDNVLRLFYANPPPTPAATAARAGVVFLSDFAPQGPRTEGGAAGADSSVSRSDHRHPLPTFAQVQSILDTGLGGTAWRSGVLGELVAVSVATAGAWANLRTGANPPNIAVASASYARGAAPLYLTDGTQPAQIAAGDLFIFDGHNDRWERVVNLPDSVTGAVTNLTLARDGTSATIQSSTGTNATIPEADDGLSGLAGVQTPSNKRKVDRQQDNPLATPAARTGPWRTLDAYTFAPYSAGVWNGNTLAAQSIMPAALAASAIGNQRRWQIHFSDLDASDGPGVLADLAAAASTIKILDGASEVYEGRLVPDTVAERATNLYLFSTVQVSYAEPAAGDALRLSVQSEIDVMLDALRRGELNDDVLSVAKILAGTAAEKAGWRLEIQAAHIGAGNDLPALADHNVGDVWIIAGNPTPGANSFVDIRNQAMVLDTANPFDVMLVFPGGRGVAKQWTRVGTIGGINPEVQAALDAEKAARQDQDASLAKNLADLRRFIGGQQIRVDPPVVATGAGLVRNYTLHIQSLEGIPETATKLIVSAGGAHGNAETRRNGNFILAWDNAWVRGRRQIQLTRLTQATYDGALAGGNITANDHSLPVIVGFYGAGWPDNANQQVDEALASFTTAILIGSEDDIQTDFTVADKRRLPKADHDLVAPYALPAGNAQRDAAERVRSVALPANFAEWKYLALMPYILREGANYITLNTIFLPTRVLAAQAAARDFSLQGDSDTRRTESGADIFIQGRWTPATRTFSAQSGRWVDIAYAALVDG